MKYFLGLTPKRSGRYLPVPDPISTHFDRLHLRSGKTSFDFSPFCISADAWKFVFPVEDRAISILRSFICNGGAITQKRNEPICHMRRAVYYVRDPEPISNIAFEFLLFSQNFVIYRLNWATADVEVLRRWIDSRTAKTL